jgi:hypothetical protein
MRAKPKTPYKPMIGDMNANANEKEDQNPISRFSWRDSGLGVCVGPEASDNSWDGEFIAMSLLSLGRS